MTGFYFNGDGQSDPHMSVCGWLLCLDGLGNVEGDVV